MGSIDAVHNSISNKSLKRIRSIPYNKPPPTNKALPLITSGFGIREAYWLLAGGGNFWGFLFAKPFRNASFLVVKTIK